MRVLGFETASYSGGVAYRGPEGRFTEGPFEARSASREILAAVDRILEKVGVGVEEIDLVAASSGPGLFTGVRVGLSIAKTIVWNQKQAHPDSAKPALVEVPTLAAVAMCAFDRDDFDAAEMNILAVSDARRGEVYAARYSADAKDRTILARSEDIVVRPDKLLERLAENDPEMMQQPCYLIGDGAARYRETFEKSISRGSGFESPDSETLLQRLIDLGVQSYEKGRTVSPVELEPHYVRRPDARPPASPFKSK